jgi:uncharacterized protein YkwD
MAARPVLPVAPAAATALLLALLLSGIPPSAPDTIESHPVGDLLTKAGTANATSSSTNSSAPAPPPPPPPSASDLEKQKEKQRQQQEEAKALDAAFREYGRTHSVVSPTNGAGSYKGMAREFVDAHNEARARYGVPPIKWDKKLARHARRWCNSVRGNCALVHSVTQKEGYGESLFLSSEYWNATATDAVKFWATEEPIYDKDTGNCTGGRPFRECGHFALMVDKRNQWVGCARAECVNGGVFISCNYYIHDPSKVKIK